MVSQRHESGPVGIGWAQAQEAVPLARSPGSEYTRDNGRIVQPATEDRLNEVVQLRPHNVHVRLLALGDEIVRNIACLQVTGEIDAH